MLLTIRIHKKSFKISQICFDDNAAEPFVPNAPNHYDDEELVDYSLSLVEDVVE